MKGSIDHARELNLAALPLVLTHADLRLLADEAPRAMPDEPLVDVGTKHHLAAGLYGRSVVISAGTMCMGADHAVEGFALIVGDISVWFAGQARQRFTGAHFLTSKPGPRMVLAHADTTWITVHPNTTGGTDIAAIEDSIVNGAQRLMSRQPLALTLGDLQ
jgi:hypothetical protein